MPTPAPQSTNLLSSTAEIVTIITGIWAACEKYRAWRKAKDVGATTLPPEATGSRARTPRDRVIGILLSLACALLWSISYVSLSYVQRDASPLETSTLMLLPGFAFVFIFAGAYHLREHKTTGRRFAVDVDWATFAPWIVIVANVASFLLFVYALNFISASQTITLHKINPVFVGAITWLWLRERPTRLTVSSLLLVVFAVLIITADDKMRFTAGAPLTGSILAMLAGFMFAVFTVALDKIDRAGATRAGQLFFLGIVFFVSYSALVTVAYFTNEPVPLQTKTLVILAANGLRVALVYALYQAAIGRIGPVLTSVIVALEVPLTMFFERVLLHRPPSARLILGSVGVLAGALVLASESTPKADGKPSP